MESMPFEVLLEKRTDAGNAAITVVMTCYKYGKEGLEALASLLPQTEPAFNLIVIDDRSPDDSVAILLPWLEGQRENGKFENILFIRHLDNAGLSAARNTAISLVTTPYVFILDADNSLYPKCLALLRRAIEQSGQAMAYSLVELFGDKQGVLNNSLWIPEKFAYGNYIDAMTLVRTEVLRELGGYRQMPFKFGHEDFDLWCTFVDHGLGGCHVPQILCRYRVHGTSMLNTQTIPLFTQHKKHIIDDLEAHHSFKFYL
jgi:glycosyltransferase involved in cell wall biosynthesis